MMTIGQITDRSIYNNLRKQSNKQNKRLLHNYQLLIKNVLHICIRKTFVVVVNTHIQ